MTAIGLDQTVLTNARIVLADQVVEGAVEMAGGVITDIGSASARGVDLEGDYLIPGLVELHTDHLETHYAPRPKVRWHPVAAVQAHDAQIAASGITTVFDAIRVGTDEHADMGAAELRILADAVTAGVTARRLRADHLIHLRCEVSAPDCLDAFEGIMDHPLVRLASLMDHAPGQRQFANPDAYRAYYQGKLKMSDAQLAEFIDRRTLESITYSDRHRRALAAHCHDRGIRIAEFPTTMEAARASREAGLAILMGGPNVVRGGSHSGNVSARDLAAAGLLDILSSDYIPFSMLQSAFCLVDQGAGIDMPTAISLVTSRPAKAAGLDDRGEIALGKRADLVQVRIEDGVPIVRTVWRQGRRVL
jgi:alpha-D-ribose 1-methylphosphonate 5-triphosphate diphosphatase